MASLRHNSKKIPLHILLLVSSAALLFLSANAQYAFDDEDDSSPSPTSYIAVAPETYMSLSPDASPAPSPAYALVGSDFDSDSNSEDESGGSTDEMNLMAVDTPADENPTTATFTASASAIPVASRGGVNTFVQSTMQKSVVKTDNFIENVIEKRLKDPKTDSYTKDCLETCKEVYEDSLSAMKKTLEDISDNNYFKANVDVSAMSNDADTCKECVKKVYGEDPEFDQFSKWVDGVIDDCLTKITGVPA